MKLNKIQKNYYLKKKKEKYEKILNNKFYSDALSSYLDGQTIKYPKSVSRNKKKIKKILNKRIRKAKNISLVGSKFKIERLNYIFW